MKVTLRVEANPFASQQSVDSKDFDDILQFRTAVDNLFSSARSTIKTLTHAEVYKASPETIDRIFGK